MFSSDGYAEASFPAVSSNTLPSPDSIRHPAVPLPIRHKSMPDIFRWSADDMNPYPSSNFLFFSSCVEEEDETPFSFEPRASRSQSVSAGSVKKKDGSVTPDPFSPFPEDYSDDDATFMMEFEDRSSNEPGTEVF
jgi:hypothetical protein